VETEKNTGRLILGVAAGFLMVVATLIWLILASQGKIPDIGLGIEVKPLYLFIGLVVAAVILFVALPKGKAGQRRD
jgi:hypothetical protein